ncbi:MipA family protein [Sphingomonas spermidinifaciens]|uniref:MipA family protein n=1 Tax=Sphingomonas spermidinifaciens TaxID=1141889 RepID=A0A2A4B3C3_9SPHN|nr:MipA/OmpV family protein [Sphingomonas spermidinifaciens]PCD02184.1 MipA family protein [Sphingomonas spermidinifaciens]
MRLLSTALIALVAAMPIPVAAQDGPPDEGPHGQVASGAGLAPDYEGSDDLRVIPFVLADIRWAGVTLEMRGLHARVDLASDPRLSLGPVIGARLDRSDVDGSVGLLPEIDTAIEAGGYVGYRFGGNRLGQGSMQVELSVVHDISEVHNGLLATVSTSYMAIRKPDSFVSFDLQTTWADADYTQTYFGISAADAAASGLATFDAGSGFRDVGAGISAGYYFSRSLGIVGRVGANYLIGDAADSPVTDQGSRWQPVGGLTLSYRF